MHSNFFDFNSILMPLRLTQVVYDSIYNFKVNKAVPILFLIVFFQISNNSYFIITFDIYIIPYA